MNVQRKQFVGEQVATLDNIIWSDKACFKFSSYVKRHNCEYWAVENPNLTIKTQLSHPGITVWNTFCRFTCPKIAILFTGSFQVVFSFFFFFFADLRRNECF